MKFDINDDVIVTLTEEGAERVNKLCFNTSFFAGDEYRSKLCELAIFGTCVAPYEPEITVCANDRILDAIEDWCASHPDESTEPVSGVMGEPMLSMRDKLVAMRQGTLRGNEEYKNLIQLTVNLLTRGKLDSPVQESLVCEDEPDFDCWEIGDVFRYKMKELDNKFAALSERVEHPMAYAHVLTDADLVDVVERVVKELRILARKGTV